MNRTSPCVVLLAVLLGCGDAEETGASFDEDLLGATTPLAAATYELGTSVGVNKCVDVSGAGSADGTKIQQWECNGTGAQSFRVEDLGNGVARLVNGTTGKCVDAAGAGTADGTQIQLWTCNGSGAQTFWITDEGAGRIRIRNTNSNKCVDVNGLGTADGTKIQLWSCNNSNAQVFRTKLLGCGAGGLPEHVVAGYYPNWTEAPVRLRDVHARYNVIYLFAARPEGGSPGTTGRVTWTPPGNGRGAATSFNADLQHARTVQGRKIILSVGGAGNGMSFPDRAKSQRFVDSIVGLYNQFGGFDGLDWNTFEADQAPDTAEMIWISLELKRRYPGFLVTAPPAPWNNRDKTFCAQMVAAGAMDYAAPQYYDGPKLATQAYVVNSVNEWVGLLGASKVVVGFGIWDQPNYMSIEQAVPTWNQVKANHPALRGGFNWQIHIDESRGWAFANGLGPIIDP